MISASKAKGNLKPNLSTPVIFKKILLFSLLWWKWPTLQAVSPRTSPCVQPSSLKPVRKYSQGTEPDGEQSEIPDQKQFSNFYFKSFIYRRHYSFYGTLKTPFKSLYSFRNRRPSSQTLYHARSGCKVVWSQGHLKEFLILPCTQRGFYGGASHFVMLIFFYTSTVPHPFLLSLNTWSTPFFFFFFLCGRLYAKILAGTVGW